MKKTSEVRSKTTLTLNTQLTSGAKIEVILSDSEIKFQSHRKRNGLIAEWENFSDRESSLAMFL